MPRIAPRLYRASLCAGCVLVGAACGGPDPNVTTQHNDNFRTGAYLAETTLTPQRVAAQGMHVRYWIAPHDEFLPSSPPGQPVGEVEGGIVTQLLYLRSVQFERETANGLFAGTMRAKLYAINADNGSQEWVRNLMEGDPGCRVPRGLDATPVIDVGHGRIFALFSTLGGNTGEGCDQSLFGTFPIRYFLASLDIHTGSGFFKQVQAKDDRSGLPFDEQTLNAHPALLLDRGSLFIAFGSDAALEGKGLPFRGWVMRYNAADLSLRNTFTTSPTETGAGVWQGGGGLAADGTGSVFFLTGNGPTDFAPHPAVTRGVQRKYLYGDAFMRLSISGGRFVPAAFAPEIGCEPNSLCATDADLGSGGAMIIPGSNNVVGGGKTGVMYLLDRGSMSLLQQFDASTNQYHPDWRGQDWEKGPHLHGSPTYWRGPDSRYGYLYVWGEKDYLKLYRYDTSAQRFEKRMMPTSRFGMTFGVFPYEQAKILALPNTMPGGMLSVSADGNNRNSGIVWATLPVAPCLPSLDSCWMKERPPFPFGVYAFDAETLKLLWNDATFSVEGPHWAPPTIADGKLFVPWGVGMIVAYDLCREGVECIGGSRPIQPVRPPSPCGGTCHSTPFDRATLAYTPLAKRFQSEGTFAALPKMTLRMIAPPAEARQDLVLSGEGVLLYDAAGNPEERGRLQWRLKDSTAELTEFRATDKAGAQAKALLRIQIAPGMKWSASDGSSAIAQMEKSASAPEKKDAAWTLYRLMKGAGQGALSTHQFAQLVYTDGGAPPEAPPQRRGEAARVKFRAQAWLYR